MSERTSLLGRDRALSALEELLKGTDADQTEAVLMVRNENLTRFAGNTIHQNLAGREITVTVRAVVGNRIGTATTGRLDPDSLRDAVRRAGSVARVRPGDPDFRSLPEPQPVESVSAYCEHTASFDASARAEMVRTVVSRAERAGLSAAGSLSISIQELAVANSLGVRAYAPQTRASLTAIPSSDTSSGYASGLSTEVSDLDAAALAERAVKKCLDGQNPRPVEPGDYQVVLEPEAVSDLVSSLALAFNADWVREGRSPFAGRIGERVCGENITLRDDGLDPAGIPLPFDFEGVPRNRLSLIDRGVAREMAYDSYIAGKEDGARSTGHALPAQLRMYGAVPAHLFLEPGGDDGLTVDEMVKRVERGLLVTRFNYNRTVHPVRMLITGLTRDGTWYIEDGRIRYPVVNLRYTQSVLDALSSVTALGIKPEIKTFYAFATCSVPALAVERFSFTGETSLTG